MPATDVARAANARMVTRVEYGIDPRGWALANALRARFQRGIAGTEGVRHLPTHATWHGYAQPLQHFAGLAGLAGGSAAPVIERTTTLTDSRSVQLTDPGLSVFADRMRRQR